MSATFDIAIVGAGIVGLGHALAAARKGRRVLVVDRDAQANGASIRNFGFVTVTGQQAGDCWRRARRSRDVWAEVAPAAGIAVEHEGLVVAARRPEAAAVLEAFRTTDMGQDCRMLAPHQALERVPTLRADDLEAVLWSPHELRIESRTAIPKLAAWLAEVHGVTFWRSTLVTAIDGRRLVTTRGVAEAGAIVVCPGDDFLTLYPGRIATYGLTKCLLHMLRVDPGPDVRLGAAVMSDLGLVRYLGYAELPEAAALRQRLEAEQGPELANGIHLIAVQSADGTLVVGDSHHYGETMPPFAPVAVDRLILDELAAVLRLPATTVTEHWTGIYASAKDRLMLVDRPEPHVRIVIVTSGTGASTAFAIGEEVVGELL
jgi:FAD dependent oxidoreductase TIGR03364